MSATTLINSQLSPLKVDVTSLKFLECEANIPGSQDTLKFDTTCIETSSDKSSKSDFYVDIVESIIPVM